METIKVVITADRRYKVLSKDVRNQIELLNKKLKRHNLNQSYNKSDYGYGGDMAYILDKLKELNSFIK